MATTDYNSSATSRVEAQLALKGGFNVETLAATFTMDKSSATYQKLDPGGASREVHLPSSLVAYGPFFIENVADAAETLTVKGRDGTTTVGTLAQGEAAWFGYDIEAAAYVMFGKYSASSDPALVGDTISEYTAAAGVTIDSLLIKDGKVDLNGVAGALILDADADTHIGSSVDDDVDITINGAVDFKLVANIFRALSGSVIETDTINETTAASGVTVDGLLIKDGSIQAVAIADPGTGVAIPVTKSGSVAITTAAAETNTLAIPTFLGQTLTLFVDTYAVGDRVVTSAQRINQAGNTIMTFGAAGDFIKLEAITIGGALRWQVVANDGVALS